MKASGRWAVLIAAGTLALAAVGLNTAAADADEPQVTVKSDGRFPTVTSPEKTVACDVSS